MPDNLTTVLFIDDDPEDLKKWSTALRECSPNYSVLEASSGRAGVDIFQQQKVDCIVLDLDLPDMHGFEVLFDFIPNRKQPSIAVVVLTRLPYSDLHSLVLHNGAQVCLVKTRTSPTDLERAVQSAIALVSSKRRVQ